MSGPLPHFQPEFPGEFVDRVRDIVRCHTSEKRLWQRARMVVLLEENPQRNHVDIGREVGLSDQAVRKWRKRWCQGDFSLEDKPRSGRPADFSPGRRGRGQGRRLRNRA
jgi:transposase-like protein